MLKQQAVGDRIRRLRTDAGLSLRALASRTDFSPSFISQVENGLVSPSINSMQKIAEALGVTLAEFFAAAAGGEGGNIVRAAERPKLDSSWSRGAAEALATTNGSEGLTPLLITLDAGGRSGKHPSPSGRAEFAFVIAGEVRLTLGPETYTLHVGDAVMIVPRELRVWVNEGTASAQILVVSVSAVRS